ncbi:MAG: pyridoxamine 5'-phosphate oxidase family protein [Caldilineaceae bacterium]|nr:pyridoxamine 5'-phosphate oxidase family protein [Caldilineaceae bacterium]MBP8107903.1 pyridoxamine 5'-phosphate oxidase family protein [Caldilineaceae bacterium]MBP8123793.1 pyridoxamine 5'-phosphate oxidase family protein [Caldilineaceae bacterium]MBP9073586.1 pyridoxamine 5'-phosphate oxidase family protein [Caldilineaceae bacterium]
MDTQSQQILAQLIRGRQTAALGTLRNGAPFVSMVPYAVADDLTAFDIHISTLAHHTKDILADGRVSLMIAAPEGPDADAQTLARVSIQGEAVMLPKNAPDYVEARIRYLTRFPAAATSFNLGDFALYRIQLQSARFVAGFGRIFNLKPDAFQDAAKVKHDA